MIYLHNLDCYHGCNKNWGKNVIASINYLTFCVHGPRVFIYLFIKFNRPYTWLSHAEISPGSPCLGEFFQTSGTFSWGYSFHFCCFGNLFMCIFKARLGSGIGLADVIMHKGYWEKTIVFIRLTRRNFCTLFLTPYPEFVGCYFLSSIYSNLGSLCLVDFASDKQTFQLSWFAASVMTVFISHGFMTRLPWFWWKYTIH